MDVIQVTEQHFVKCELISEVVLKFLQSLTPLFVWGVFFVFFWFK